MRKYIFAFLFGVVASYSMAPNNLVPVLFISLGGLYVYVTFAKSAFKAGLIGFLFSLGYFGFSLSWVGNALLVEGNPYWWAWPIAISGLPFILSFFTAFACYVHKYICKGSNNIWTYLSFCFFLSAAEYARGHLFTGFPWNLYGLTWIDVLPIAQLASLWDIYLLTTITIIWASFPIFIVSTDYKKSVKIICSFLIVCSFISSYVFGVHRIQSYNPTTSKNISLVVVQPNIKQSEKWKAEKLAENFMGLIEQSQFGNNSIEESSSYIVVWPETAINQGILDSPWALEEISRMLRSYPDEAFLMTGILRYDRDKDVFYNSIIILDANSTIKEIYDKSHLVPFGEYMPLSSIIDIAPIVGFKGFQKGTGQKSLKLSDNINIGTVICYEIIFPKYTKFNAQTKPEMIVNVTNDAWYGLSAGPYQHLVQAQFRAIESGIPVVRSANTGISAVISPIGFISSYVSLEQKNTINQKLLHPID